MDIISKKLRVLEKNINFQKKLQNGLVGTLHIIKDNKNKLKLILEESSEPIAKHARAREKYTTYYSDKIMEEINQIHNKLQKKNKKIITKMG